MHVEPQILKQGGQEDKGETARLQSFVGAIAVGDLLKTTLGPKGRDKILQPIGGEGSSRTATVVTNDGATIVKAVWLENAAAKILVDLSRRQDTECGDGTTGVVVLAAELLRNAEFLISDQKIHPQIVIQGYRLALDAAKARLREIKMDVFAEESNNGDSEPEDVKKERKEKALRQRLLNVAMTTLSSKLLTHEKEQFANLAVEAIMRLSRKCTVPANLELVQIIKKTGGTLRQSYLSDGFLIEKTISPGQPKKRENCKVLLCNTPMDTDKIKIYGARVKVDSFSAVAELEEAERQKMKEKVEAMARHGCNVLINRQLIYNYPEQLLNDHDIICIEHADFDGVEKLAAALDAEIASTFDNPEKTRLGTCDLLEEIQIGDSRLLKFTGCKKNEACSIVLRGANEHILQEAERSLHDALAILAVLAAEPAIVPGAGCAELAMASAVDVAALTTSGKRAIAMEGFAKALRQIPTIILDNGGFDAAETVADLKARHFKGERQWGVDCNTGGVCDAAAAGIVESFKAKMAQLCAAAEAAEMIIRVDEIIKCAPRRREGM